MKASERPIAKIIDICRLRDDDHYIHLPEHHRNVLGRISACRTGQLGVISYTCENEECKHTEMRFASCKNRACSVCSWLPREKWRMQRQNDMVPYTPYYHYVFTVPHIFSQIASQNQVEFQNLLLSSVNRTLKAFTKTHCKSGQIGFLLVLHTWSTRLMNHYHVHCAMPGGYLKDGVWHPMSEYMFPARGLADMFKNKICSGLRKMHREGRLNLDGDLAQYRDKQKFSDMVNEKYHGKWYVHAEKTKGKDPSRIIGYLSNYVYKTAIDHSRIESITPEAVTFSYRSHDEDDRGQFKQMSLRPEEFLRRFTGHIQPKRYMRIRYYGFLGGGVKKEYLGIIFKQLETKYEAKNQSIHLSSCETIIQMSGKIEVACCSVCGSRLISPWERYRLQGLRGPPNDNSENINNERVCA